MFNTTTFLCFYVSYPLQDRSDVWVCGCTPVVLPIKQKQGGVGGGGGGGGAVISCECASLLGFTTWIFESG